MINRSGTTFVHRAIEETGAEVAQITRAYSVVREVFGLEQLWADLEALDNEVSTEAQHAGYQEIRRLDRPGDPLVRRRALPDLRRRRRDRAVRADPGRAEPAHHRRWCAAPNWPTSSRSRSGWPRSACRRSWPRTSPNCSARSCCSTSSRSPTPASHSAAEIAALHFALSDQFYVDEMLTASPACRATTGGRRWPARRCATTSTPRCRRSRRRSCAPPTTRSTADDRTAAWTAQNPERVERARTTVRAALDRDTVDLATLSVALRVMRGLPS